MDEMRLESKFTTGLVSKIARTVVRKKLGYDMDIRLNRLRTTVVDEKTHVHLDVDLERFFARGITNGMPGIFRAAIKPTPSIAQAQRTIDIAKRENAVLEIAGRHDPCIVPRAVVVLESILAIALCELMMDDAAQRALEE